MNLIWRKLLLSLVVSTVLLSLCSASDFPDCDDSDECEDYDDWKLSNGAIAGTVIATLVLFFGIPILLCFCCAWCCFRHRRSFPGTIVASAPPPPQYPQQQYYHNEGGQPQAFINRSQYSNNEFNQNPSTSYDLKTFNTGSHNPSVVQSGASASNVPHNDVSHGTSILL